MAVLNIPWHHPADWAIPEMEEALKEYEAAIEKVREAGNELASELIGEERKEFIERQKNLLRWSERLIMVSEDKVSMVRKWLDDFREEFDFPCTKG